MTSGIDSIVKQKKDDLDSLKVTSYYQRKKTQDEIEEDARLARPKNLVGARKKRWVDLDQDGFEEREGVIVEDVSEAEETDAEVDEDEPVAQDENDIQPSPKEETPVEEEAEQEVEEEEKEEEEDDIFDTEFVNEQLAVLDLKLNEIPDSPIDEGPDVFDTNYASDIVQKAEKERAKAEKAENDKIKFGCIAAAADVLTGKSAAVDKSAVEHTIRKRPGRPRPRPGVTTNQEPEPEVVTAAEDVDSAKLEPTDDSNISAAAGDSKITVGSTSAEASPVVPGSPNVDLFPSTEPAEPENATGIEDSNEPNEIVEPPEEEEEEDDPFDAAFDELAKEALQKVNIDDITADLFNEDLFDTSAADAVLNLASLTNVVEKEKEEEEIVLDTFDDKDPFDTSAYEHITKDFEEDLEFESLAKRDPNETSSALADAGKYKTMILPWKSMRVLEIEFKLTMLILCQSPKNLCFKY